MREQKGPCQARTTRRKLCCFVGVFVFCFCSGGWGKAPARRPPGGGHFGRSFWGKQKAPARQAPPGAHVLGSFGPTKRPLPGNGYQEDIFWMYGPMGQWGMPYIAKMCGYIWDPPHPLNKKEIPLFRDPTYKFKDPTCQ